MLKVDAYWCKGVQIDTPNLNVLNAALTKCRQWTFTTCGTALGSNGAVKFVFYLQNRVVKLLIIAVFIDRYMGIAWIASG